LLGLADRVRKPRIGAAVFQLVEACELGLDLADLAIEAGEARRMLGDRALELIAPRHKVSERAGQFGARLLDRVQRAFGLRDARRNALLARRDARGVVGEPRLFGREPFERGRRIGGEALLALDVLRELNEAAV